MSELKWTGSDEISIDVRGLPLLPPAAKRESPRTGLHAARTFDVIGEEWIRSA
jgi:hypothetical protein